VGLVWSNDLESYDGGGIATGRATHAEQVEGDDPDEKRYPDPPGWELGERLTTFHRKIYICLETSTKRKTTTGKKHGLKLFIASEVYSFVLREVREEWRHLVREAKALNWALAP
jgi:hypothetical protein